MINVFDVHPNDGWDPDNMRLARGLAAFFLDQVYLTKPSDRALIAVDSTDGTVIAMMRFRIRRLAWMRTIRMLGTWVSPSWRGHNLAKRLWRRMFRLYRPHTVRVTTVSAAGHGLVQSLMRSAERMGCRLIENPT